MLPRPARFRTLPVLFLTALALIAFACSGPGKKPQREAGGGGMFRVRYADEMRTFDWTRSTAAIDAWGIKNVMEGLVDIGTQGEVRPRLAESYSLSDDGLTYRFRLRRDVRWTDGQRLEARQFLDAWNRQPLFSATRLSSPDSHTLEIQLPNPAAEFIWYLAHWSTYPIRKDLIDADPEHWMEPGRIVTLGPYRVKEWTRGKQVVLTRNTDYWGERPQVAEVRFLTLDDDAAAAGEYAKGGLEHYWPSTGKGLTLASGIATPGGYVAPGIAYLALSQSRLSRNLRLAISHALDREELAKAAGTFPEIAFAPSRSVFIGDARDLAPEENASKARALWRSQTGKPAQLELLALDASQARGVAQAVAARLTQVLGVRIKPNYLSGEELDARIASANYQLVLAFTAADSPDPISTCALFESGSGNNPLGFGNASYNTLLDLARKENSSQRRLALLREAIGLLQKELAVFVPLFHPRVTYFLGKGVTGFLPNPLGDADFRPIESPTLIQENRAEGAGQ